MKIGFSILSHQAPNPIFEQLIHELNRFTNQIICVHHDFEQTPISKQYFESRNLLLTRQSYRTHWSHTNNIHALWETFKTLYENQSDWFITLSTSCFPIKPHMHIEAFLRESQADGYMETNNVFEDNFDFYTYFRKAFNTKYMFSIPFISKYGKFYWRALRLKRKKNKIPFHAKFIPYHGSDWFMINRKAMSYLLENEERVFQINNFLKTTNSGPDLNVCPPELVFHSVLKNNRVLNLENKNYRYIDWKDAKNWHPNSINDQHWELLLNSDALFARKFTPHVSDKILEKIKSTLL